MMLLAPIAIFVYNRPDHLTQTIEALRNNTEAKTSELFVFADAAKYAVDTDAVNEVRRCIRHISGFAAVHVVERRENYGLANSIIAGVDEMCERFGRVIVLEDDLIVSPNFLTYMNAALERYAGDESVYQVSGYAFPVNHSGSDKAKFLPVTTSWGWGTWKRAWVKFANTERDFEVLRNNRSLRRRFDLGGAYPYYAMLQRQRAGRVDSWAIRWYLSVFINRGLVLYPATSHVKNIGFDGSGRHCGDLGAVVFTNSVTVRPGKAEPDRFPDLAGVDELALMEIASHLRKARRRAAMMFIKRRLTRLLPASIRQYDSQRPPETGS
jgi:GT2 family glycosyltransferase